MLFCVVPIGLAAWLGGDLAAGLLGPDDPWSVAAGAVLFGLGLWLWQRGVARGRFAPGC
ncbi:MAG: hypothetical protein P8Y29_01825 [Gemmatimonadota bacterium]